MQNENRLDDNSLENGINEESGRIYGVRTNSNNSINTLDSNNNLLSGGDENSSINENNNNNNNNSSNNENQIKTEFHIKETLLKKIINNNDTVDENNKNNIKKSDKDIKDEKEKNEKINKIPLKEEVIKNLDNYIKNSQSENSASEIVSSIGNTSNKENKNLLADIKEIINKIPDTNKFAEELTEQIITDILKEQGINSFNPL